MNDFMQRALAKQPADRYTTPREFINALEQIQDRLREMPPVERPGKNGDAKPRPYNNVPAPPPQKEARLIVLSNGQPIPLRGDLMVVGRQDPTLGIFPEINLADKTVGRRHAYLRQQQGNYTVEDLNALNKTRLNGVTLTPHEERSLKDGDLLRFGSVEVRFELR
jgi:serine/threonine-protein kinase